MVADKLGYQGLYQKALHHAGRYGGSANRLAEILQRHIQKYTDDADESAQAANLIPDIIEKLKQDKFIDDKRFVESRCASRLAKGDSFTMLRMKLHHQGIEKQEVDEMLARLLADDCDSEYHALEIYARKRKLHLLPQEQAEQKLYNHGFPYQLVRRYFE